MVKQNPIKQTFGGLANIDDWQFIADTDRTLTVDCYNIKGQWVERLALAIPATPVTARKLCGGKLNNHWWWSVVSISAGTIYGLPTVDSPITTTVGLTLTAADKLGPAPPNGPVIQAAGIGVVEIDTTGLATGAKQDTQITHLSEIEGAVETAESALGNVTGSISVSAALPVGDEGNATVTLNGAAGVEFEVTAVSGLHVTVEAILASGGTYREVESYQIASGYERHRKAGQDITLVAADRIFVPGDYYAVRLKRASGTSATVTTRTLGPGMVAKLLAAPIEYKPLTNQNIANGTLDDAGGTTLTVPTGAMGAWITLIETTLGTPAYVYMTTDGGTPSATDGSTLKCLNQPFELIGSDLIAAVKFLAVDAGSRLNAEFFEIVRRVG